MNILSTIELKAKTDAARRSVYGWGNVATHKGVPVVDSQGGYIPIDVLEKAVKAYTAEGGRVQFQHESLDNPIRGKVTQSFVMKSDVAKSLGIDTDKEGWLVEIEVDDPNAWEVVQKGYISGLSLGGVQKFLTGAEEAKRLKDNPNAAPEDVKLVSELAIKELSLVFAPANPLATVDMVVSKGKESDMTTPAQLDRIKELEEQVAKMQAEKQEMEVKLSALAPKEPVTMESLMAKGIDNDVLEFIQSAVAKAQELQSKLEVMEMAAAKAEALASVAGLGLGELEEPVALALLKAGDAKEVILDALKALKGAAIQAKESSPIALACKPKGVEKSGSADGIDYKSLKSMDDIKNAMMKVGKG